VQDNSTLTLSIQGLFLYIGDSPWVNFVKIDGVTNERGYLVVDRRGETKVKHLYACGDCTDTLLRQVVTASSDGALVATSIHDDYQNQN
ncbi:MAG: NAD(P)/FAD-dependent oxidoreductase, partial [Bacilli bacterium]|nr:NAD(P)/FAD-dependent oxidoreductase [Bacilli bacterium]